MADDDEVARYREAARLTLQQVDWCVNYLRSIRKTQIARAIAENSSAIAQRLEDIESGHPRHRPQRQRRQRSA